MNSSHSAYQRHSSKMNYLYNDLNMRTENEIRCTRFDYATKRKYDRNAQLRIIAGLRLLSIKIVDSKSSLNRENDY